MKQLASRMTAEFLQKQERSAEASTVKPIGGDAGPMKATVGVTTWMASALQPLRSPKPEVRM